MKIKRHSKRPSTNITRFTLTLIILSTTAVYGWTTSPSGEKEGILQFDRCKDIMPEIYKTCSHWRHSAGDGNCFFRSFSFLVLEHFAGKGRQHFDPFFNHMNNLTSEHAAEVYSRTADGQVSTHTQDADRNLIETRMNRVFLTGGSDANSRLQVFDTFKEDAEFDGAMIRLFRHAIATRLHEAPAWCHPYSGFTLEADIEETVRETAWSTPAAVNVAPFIFSAEDALGLAIHDINSGHQVDYYAQGADGRCHQPKAPQKAESYIHVFLSPNHYDMLYARPSGSIVPPFPAPAPAAKWYDPVYVKVLLALAGVVVLAGITVGIYFAVTSFATEPLLEPVVDIV